MTVQDLIEELLVIQDKTQLICFRTEDNRYYTAYNASGYIGGNEYDLVPIEPPVR